jgi:hypothetical protein
MYSGPIAKLEISEAARHLSVISSSPEIDGISRFIDLIQSLAITNLTLVCPTNTNISANDNTMFCIEKLFLRSNRIRTVIGL